MKAYFYDNNSLTIKINKTLGNELELDIVFLDNNNVLRPTLILRNDLGNRNYCKIPLLGRCYFIENIERLRGGDIKAYLRIDVLESYKDDILNCECEVVECNDNFDVDNVTYNEKNKTVIEKHEIENIFSGDSIVLVTVQ